MSSQESFENITFDPFEVKNKIMLNNNADPDDNFFDENAFISMNAQYVSVQESKTKLSTCSSNCYFSILHIYAV